LKNKLKFIIVGTGAGTAGGKPAGSGAYYPATAKQPVSPLRTVGRLGGGGAGGVCCGCGESPPGPPGPPGLPGNDGTVNFNIF
jgi:hypothetical protein